MAKMNELSQVLDELVSCGEGMIHAANALREIFSAGGETPAETQPANQPEPENEMVYSFMDVRKAFSAKSHAGYTEQVKALITRYGADKLSSVKEADYPALMADLEAIR